MDSQVIDEENIREILIDAGCNKLVINEVIDLAKKKEFDGIYNIVLKQRKNVLEKLHKSQKKIDILDYFVENLKKINTTNNQKK